MCWKAKIDIPSDIIWKQVFHPLCDFSTIKATNTGCVT